MNKKVVEYLIELLNEDKWEELRRELDKYKGSYAVGYMAEALTDRRNLQPLMNIIGRMGE